MGYMGFGLQNWIYRQRPRKPFSKQTKSNFEPLPTYNREFNLQKNDNYSKGYNSTYVLVILLVLSVIFIYILFDYVIIGNSKTTPQVKQDNKESLDIIIESANNYRKYSEWKSAQKELELALKLDPNNLVVNKLYIQTLFSLCLEDTNERVLYIREINRAIDKFPTNLELLNLKANYLLSVGDTVNANFVFEKIYNN